MHRISTAQRERNATNLATAGSHQPAPLTCIRSPPFFPARRISRGAPLAESPPPSQECCRRKQTRITERPPKKRKTVTWKRAGRRATRAGRTCSFLAAPEAKNRQREREEKKDEKEWRKKARIQETRTDACICIATFLPSLRARALSEQAPPTAPPAARTPSLTFRHKQQVLLTRPSACWVAGRLVSLRTARSRQRSNRSKQF